MRLLMPSCLLFVSAAAGAKEPLYIAASIPLAEDAGIDPAFVAECPFQTDFAATLQRSLRGFGAELVDGPLDTARKGRVLNVEIQDLSTSGNGFIGRQNYIRLRGTLYQDGRKVAAFFDKAPVPGGEWTSACYSVRSNLRAEAYYIRKWMENPVDGAKLKHIGE